MTCSSLTMVFSDPITDSGLQRLKTSKTLECNDSCMLRSLTMTCMACHTQLPLGCLAHQTRCKGGQADPLVSAKSTDQLAR